MGGQTGRAGLGVAVTIFVVFFPVKQNSCIRLVFTLSRKSDGLGMIHS